MRANLIPEILFIGCLLTGCEETVHYENSVPSRRPNAANVSYAPGVEVMYPGQYDGAAFYFDDFKPDMDTCDYVWMEQVLVLGRDREDNKIKFLIEDNEVSVIVNAWYTETDSSGADVYIHHTPEAPFYMNMDFGVSDGIDWEPPCSAGAQTWWWFEFRVWEDDHDLFPDSIDVIFNWGETGFFLWDRDTFYQRDFYTP